MSAVAEVQQGCTWLAFTRLHRAGLLLHRSPRAVVLHPAPSAGASTLLLAGHFLLDLALVKAVA